MRRRIRIRVIMSRRIIIIMRIIIFTGSLIEGVFDGWEEFCEGSMFVTFLVRQFRFSRLAGVVKSECLLLIDYLSVLVHPLAL